MGRFLIAWLLRRIGVFRRFPGLAWRGRFRHPLLRHRWINHAQGEITSTTDRVGPVSRNSRSGRVRINLPGPLAWTSRRKRSR